MRPNIAAVVLLILLGQLTLTIDAFSRSTGKLTGRVIEESTGEPLIGVNVTIVGTQQGAMTDTDGYYVILNIRPGTYELRASYLGFQTQLVQNVRISIGQTTTIDFSLTEMVITGAEAVVIAERPIIRRDLTSSSVSVSAREIALLPVENFNDIVNLQAGVVNGHFRGGRIGEVAYLVDGIPINDSFDNSFAYQVENNSIQEVEVISGTFNAEYGQAQSGVVNIVTKDGGSTLEGSFAAYSGDYMTLKTGDFQNIGSISPTHVYDFQGTLSGPIPLFDDKLRFFLSARRTYDQGHLYGKNMVRPIGHSNDSGEIVNVNGRNVYVPMLGDSSYVPMNWGEQNTFNVKLTSFFIKGNKLSINALYQKDKGQNYNHFYQYNPDGTPTNYGESLTLNVIESYSFNSRSFATLKGAYFINRSKSYLYKDPLDPRYPRDDAQSFLGGNFSFVRGGAIMDHFSRETRTLVGALDVTSQLNRRHMIKTGAQIKLHNIRMRDFKVKNNSSTGFMPEIPPQGTPDHVFYDEQPMEISAYIQDKMEFDYLVVNLGVRFDYFESNSQVPENYGRPANSPREPTDPNWQISPRIGLAYPISDNGIVHVSYGHFFQIPSFQYLYTNPDYTYNPEVGLGRVFGNPNLKPQQTISYETGLQYGFTDVLALGVTIFYKDIRNLLGTRIEVIEPGVDEPFPLSKYGRYINRDYGQSKGVIVTLEKRMDRNFSFNMNYSLQFASGNASDPESRLLDEQAGVETEKQLVPLDWDRRHQLKASISFLTARNLVFTLAGEFGSGLPYTPSVANERIGLENSDRKPGFYSFDLYASKSVQLMGLTGGLFVRVYNLFDTRNEVNVYNDTGRVFPNLRYYSGQAQGLNSKEDFLYRPDFYSSPRRVTLGFQFSF
ncbi:MAG: TonB-dependent receptor [Balneolaceae bacterium]|nr:MAG: TonB-dependent receptor [Balneolaceae bacterium]